MKSEADTIQVNFGKQRRRGFGARHRCAFCGTGGHARRFPTESGRTKDGNAIQFHHAVKV